MSADITLRHGRLEVLLDSRLGGCCTALKYDCRDAADVVDILRPFPDGSTDPFETACFAMLPFSNRLFDGRLHMPEGPDLILPPNCHRIEVPVHGVGWMSPWTISSLSTHEVCMDLSHAPNDYWPFKMECIQRITVTGHSVRFHASICNTGVTAMPAGLGFHPRFNLSPMAHVALGAGAVWQQDQRGYPAQCVDVQGAGRDAMFADGPAHAMVMNHCFANWSGSALLNLPELELALHLSASANLRHLMVYRLPGKPWLCVEPVSHATGAFSLESMRSPVHGVRVLEPGESLAGWIDLEIV